MEPVLTDASRILGATQVAWLKRALAGSTATWKVIACDMPLGVIVWDDFMQKVGAEAVANGDNGSPLGRELEIADLLRFIDAAGIANTVWLTADVHYTAAHYYDPGKARVPGLRPLLGIRLRPAPRRNLRPERARCDLRPRGPLREGAAGRPVQPAALGRAAVLRPRRYRRRHRSR